jgi:hypothetical protein
MGITKIVPAYGNHDHEVKLCLRRSRWADKKTRKFVIRPYSSSTKHENDSYSQQLCSGSESLQERSNSQEPLIEKSIEVCGFFPVSAGPVVTSLVPTEHFSLESVSLPEVMSVSYKNQKLC